MITKSNNDAGSIILNKPIKEAMIVKSHKEKETLANINYITLRQPYKVSWAQDTINNENMNKKKSNICCIYHKPKLGPDDSDTSSCDSCDEKCKNAYERPNHYNRKMN